MRKIKYYDRINHKMLDMEVSDEISKFLQAQNRKESRKGQRDKECIAFSMDEHIKVDGNSWLSYHEVIADPKSNLLKNLKQKWFNQVIENLVNKLHDKTERYIVKAYYFKEFTAGEIATYLKMKMSDFSKHKATAIKHLRTIFCFDEKFNKTKYFKLFKEEFKRDIKNTIKQSFGINYPIEIEKIFKLVSETPQAIKVAEKLGIKIDDEQKEVIFWINKIVRDTIKSQSESGIKKISLTDLAMLVVENEVELFFNQSIKMERKTEQELKFLHKLMKDDYTYFENIGNIFVEIFKKHLKKFPSQRKIFKQKCPYKYRERK